MYTAVSDVHIGVATRQEQIKQCLRTFFTETFTEGAITFKKVCLIKPSLNIYGIRNFNLHVCICFFKWIAIILHIAFCKREKT